jgi:hypothetical protein
MLLVMSRQTRFIAALLGGLAVLVLVAVWLMMADAPNGSTSWPPAARKSFIASCVEKCRASPGVTEARYPLCDSACACAADEGEKIMTGDELGAAALAISGGTASAEQNDKMNRIKAVAMACAMRTAQEKRP